MFIYFFYYWDQRQHRCIWAARALVKSSCDTSLGVSTNGPKIVVLAVAPSLSVAPGIGIRVEPMRNCWELGNWVRVSAQRNGRKYDHWPFQDPKLEVPTIYKAYFSGLCKGISPENMARNMVLTYLHFRILKISHWYDYFWLFHLQICSTIGSAKTRTTVKKALLESLWDTVGEVAEERSIKPSIFDQNLGIFVDKWQWKWEIHHL